MTDSNLQKQGILSLAKEVLATEASALEALIGRLDDDFVKAVHALLACRGRVVVTGIGKSGHIAKKIAATMASTGTPAFFVHAAEASHGDLGMVRNLVFWRNQRGSFHNARHQARGHIPYFHDGQFQELARS